MRRILVNASNLHVGGGVQVATSFLLELARMATFLSEFEVHIVVSSEVDANLKVSGFKCESFFDYRVFDVFGLAALRGDVGQRFLGFDLVFTVFGPFYGLRRIRNHVVGFAQAWIAYPNNEAYGRLGFADALKQRLKYYVQWFFFKKADRLIVELPHVKTALVESRGCQLQEIDVVWNSVSRLYFDRALWKPLSTPISDEFGVVKVGLISRDYSHKNLDLMASVARHLSSTSSRRYRFYVTLTDREWAGRNSLFRECFVNVGELSVAQCPTFYESMDCIFFPSLLECFSVTPLEAMVMRKPLFASDRGFVRDCCGNNAIYFDPRDVVSAASCLTSWFDQGDDYAKQRHLESAYRHVISLPSSSERARAYVDIICRTLGLN